MVGRLTIVAALAALVLVFVLLSVRDRGNHSSGGGDEFSHGRHPNYCSYVLDDGIRMRIQPPHEIHLTPDQSNELKVVFLQVRAAYDRGDSEAMQKWMGALPGCVTNMPVAMFHSLAKPVRDILTSDFLNPRSLHDFGNVKAFERYARMSVELAVFWGDIYLTRECYDSPVSFLDGSVLRQLQCYKRKFHSDGRADLESSADAAIESWYGHIESENGFLRRYMWYQVELYRLGFKRGEMTMREVSDAVKGHARRVVGLGYTPKWLSEFDDLSETMK